MVRVLWHAPYPQKKIDTDLYRVWSEPGFFFDPNLGGIMIQENIFDPCPGGVMTPENIFDRGHDPRIFFFTPAPPGSWTRKIFLTPTPTGSPGVTTPAGSNRGRLTPTPGRNWFVPKMLIFFEFLGKSCKIGLILGGRAYTFFFSPGFAKNYQVLVLVTWYFRQPDK